MAFSVGLSYTHEHYAREALMRLRSILSVVTALSALSAFPQVAVPSLNQVDKVGTVINWPMPEKQIFVSTFIPFEPFADQTPPSEQEALSMFDLRAGIAKETPGGNPSEDSSEDSRTQPLVASRSAKRADFNRDIYYRNKLEFALDGGWLPINIPFVFDVFEGDAYNTYPLKYTLVPIIASLRWQMGNLGGPWILRGNWDLTISGSATAIPRGPETHYFSYDMAIRRNIVPRNWRIAPYWDMRLGLGIIDAKGPDGVKYAQGQPFTFTLNMGAGARYNFNPRFAISAGMNYMHVSNMDLSQHKGPPNYGTRNYGINVYGPMVGLDVRLRRRSPRSE
jgi:hypothetical protein